MFEKSKPLTLEYARELEIWTCAWYDEAVAANFVRPPYYPDAMIIKRLQGYFHAGLAPADAAMACFGRNH
ncbi:hypothetical protein [Paraburkholderia aspalathi]|uniref:Uncharacterized protein n=1 Tax=Paraburkholderia aspalathi TaxID=1324617 RepID=A0A1I7BDJ9_9BURK|nr:hypothetical protein [Paraburkholderia aspalathi]SFT85259.1 hypothetical protein SAMN05192563_1004380 [Paraburkholderia aspalathi]